MADRYWVGGSGTWDGTVGTKWATTSGGAGGAAVPTNADDVYFDANSGAVTVTTSGSRDAKSINFTGFTGTFNVGSNIDVYGNITLSAAMADFVFTSTNDVIAIRDNAVLTTNGKTIKSTVGFESTIEVVGSNVLTLGSNLTFQGRIRISSSGGEFDANNYSVDVWRVLSSGTLRMRSGTWTLRGESGAANPYWDIETASTLFTDTANIIINNAVNFTFNGKNGSAYNNLTLSGTADVTLQDDISFTQISSTRSDAHTINLGSGDTITTAKWLVTGSSGNVVTVASSAGGSTATLVLSGGGYTTGIDYLSVRNVIFSPISDTWYIGANSTVSGTSPNAGYGFFLTQRVANAVIVLTSTSSTTWTVPADWNSGSNTIHLIGGGGGGAGGRVSGSTTAAGGGGGGGGYRKLTNQTLSGSISYQCGTGGSGGAGGVNGSGGGTTSWNSGASTAGGGGGGSASTTPSSTGGTGGTGATFNGGTGGAGSTGTIASTGRGGGGGGGAGGPDGVGGNGGNDIGSTTSTNIAGGGGGGNGGGTAGGNATTATGGTGGNNAAGVGGGASNTSGTRGGGGGGSVSTASLGGIGIDIFGAGSGGGGGGGDDTARTNTGARYGGGGGGGGVTTGGTALAGSAGSQGAIIITYTPASAGLGFLMFM